MNFSELLNRSANIDPTSPRIIHQEHDLDKIVPSGPTGDRLEYSPTVAFAKQRANIAVVGGKVAVFVSSPTGELPWHAVGTVADRCADSAFVIHHTGMDYPLSKRPARYDWNGSPMVDGGTYLIVRDDTGQSLGAVGSGYELVQNTESFAFMDSLLEANGAFYESAGALGRGETVWITAKLPQESASIGGDEVSLYLMLTNNHNAKGALSLCATAVKAICGNTHTQALRDGRDRTIRFRHTKNIRTAMKQGAAALKAARFSFEDYSARCRNLATKRANIGSIASSVVETSLAIPEARAELTALTDPEDRDRAERALARKIARRDTWLEDILARHDSPTCEGIRGSAYGVYSAITESVDHGDHARYRGDLGAKRERHLQSIMTGEGADVKDYAFEYIQQSVSAN